MSEERKDDEVMENTENQVSDSSWDCSVWVIVFIAFILFGFGNNTDHELRERVARLEGQMDMIKKT